MGKCSGSFLDRHKVIKACEKVLEILEEKRKKREAEFYEKNRYCRNFPKFWVKKSQTNEEIEENFKNSNCFLNLIDFYQSTSKSDTTRRIELLVNLAENSTNDIYLTASDFNLISEYYNE